jgi:hypothetical protein
MRASRHLQTVGFATLVSCAIACERDQTLGLVQFNNVNDTLVMHVTADEVLGDPTVADLRSNTGSVVVGTAEVTPGSGPVGTEHEVIVRVQQDYRDHVIRSRLVALGDRGQQILPMVQDSADAGLWYLEVISYGAEGEEREDTFRFELFRAATAGEEPDLEEDLG